MKLNFENELVDQILKAVFKEASKQGDNIELSYRIYSVMCLSDLLQFSSAHFKEAYFEQYWSMFVLKIFQTELESLSQKEMLRREQQLEFFKSRLKNDQEMDHESVKTNKDDKEDIDKMSVDESAANSEKSNVEKANAEEKMDDDQKEVNLNLKIIVLVSLGKSWSFSSDIQGSFILLKQLILNQFENISFFLIEKYLYETILLLGDYLSKITWTNQILFLKSYDYLIEK